MTKLLPAQTLRIFWSCGGSEVRAKRVPLRTLANLARRVSALLGEDVPAVTRQGAVCKFMQVLSCLACGKTISRAREEDSKQKWHVSSLGRKLLRLMRKFQQSSETATKCCGDEKCIECPYYESSFETSFEMPGVRLIHPESPGPSLSNMPLTWHFPLQDETSMLLPGVRGMDGPL